MTTYDFDTVVATAIAFDPITDVLNFAAGYTAADLEFSVDGSDLRVGIGGGLVTLTNLAYAQLSTGDITFADGSMFVLGLAGNDALAGTPGGDYFDMRQGGADTVAAGAGNDRIFGGGGNDQLYGGDNNDTLHGGAGADLLSGDAGDDFLQASDGGDALFGGAGDDVLECLAAGASMLTGGTGADEFRFHDIGGDFLVRGTAVSAPALITDFTLADDIISTGISNGHASTGEALWWRGAAGGAFTASLGESLTLAGSTEARFLEFWTVFDDINDRTIVFCDRNHNRVVDSSDLRLEFSGNVAVAANWFKSGTFLAQFGNDTGGYVNLTSIDDEYYALAGDDTIDGLIGADQLSGDAGNDVLYGDVDNDTLAGGSGDDALVGSEGFDYLYGGSGSDTMTGGLGDDVLLADGYQDLGFVDYLKDTAGTVNWMYGDEGNDQLYGGSGNDKLFAEEDNDTVIGGGGTDQVDGGGGDDWLDGGTGQDTLNGAAGNDTLLSGNTNDFLNAGFGNDVIVLQVGYRGVATGGGGADYFILESSAPGVFDFGSSQSAPLRITDFDVADDRFLTDISSGFDGNAPIVWRGAAAAAFTATLGQSVALADAGEFDDGFRGFWTVFDGVNSKTILFCDRNGNGLVDNTDLRIEFNGNVALTAGLFSAGTFCYSGSDAADSYLFSVGNDSLAALGGNDSLDGGAGDDLLMGNSGDDTLVGGDGSDLGFGGAGNDSVLGDANNDTLFGGSGNDSLLGGDGNDHLWASGDQDYLGDATASDAGSTNTLLGEAGDDFLEGGIGNDNLDGGIGADILYGRDGNDTLDGGANIDYLNGGNGDDRLMYRAGDTLDGGDGNDTLVLTFVTGIDLTLSNQTLDGSSSASHFEHVDATNAGAAEVIGGSGAANQLTGGAFGDLLIGLAGNDTLNGGGATDTMEGGDGNDTYYVNIASDVVTENDADPVSGGIDLVNVIFNGSYTLAANVENLRLQGAGAANGTGNSLDNLIYAGTGNNLIDGAGGNDTLSYLYAFAGIAVDLRVLTLQFTGGSGSDTLANIEHLEGSNFADSLTGDALANRLFGLLGNDALTGGDGADTLDGGGGNDTMYGGTGNDTYRVDATGDVCTENDPAGGIDLVASSASVYTLGANFENLRLIATGNCNGIGNGLDNTIYAGSGNNVMNGGAGSDTVSYAFATSGVSVTLALVSAQNTLGSGTDTLASIESLFGSNFADGLTGNVHANVLSGGTGNDTLDGGGGADTLVGGAGDDNYAIDSVADVVTEAAAGGIDTVYSSLAATTLGANVENLRITSTGAANGTGNTLANVFWAADGNNVLNGGGGIDTLSYLYSSGGVNISLALTTAQATVGSGTDTVLNIENLVGSAFGDQLQGSGIANRLEGGDGIDLLIGAGAADVLAGGSGGDYFIYNGAGDSTLLAMDTILDFSQVEGDRIDVQNIDADSVTAGNQAFTFIGGAAFSGDATGQLRYAGGIVYGSTDADADAEFAIAVSGSPALVAADFLL